MPRKLLPAHANRGNKALGDTAIPRVGDQGVHGFLPPSLRHVGGDPVTGDDSRIAFRERNENKNP